MCNNEIIFQTKEISKVKEMLSEALDINSNEGWMPKSAIFSNEYSHYLFDAVISEEGVDFISIQCETKWSPPIKELEYIGRELQCNIYCEYDELGYEIYGQFTYDFKTDSITEIKLDDQDFGRVTYNEETDQYYLDGEEVDSDNIAYAIMLDDKINASTTNKN